MAPVRTLEQIVRALPLVLPLALIPPLVTSQPAQAEGAHTKVEAKDGDDKEYDHGARVKIELRMENGDEVRHRGEMRSFGNEWRFEFDGADRHHVVVVEATEDGKKYDATLSYERDGETIIPTFGMKCDARKREVLWNEEGNIAIALTFTPAKFEREDKSRDDKDKIAPDDGDDPLGGNPLG